MTRSILTKTGFHDLEAHVARLDQERIAALTRWLTEANARAGEHRDTTLAGHCDDCEA